MSDGAADVEAYLAGLDPEVAERVRAVREILLRAVPGGEERVRYGIPAVMLGGRYALHYAGWARHVGLYPVPRLDAALESEVAPLRTGKDGVALRHGEPLPVELVERVAAAIVAMRSA